MAKNKIERIDQEITKVREKIAEYQEKLKALEAQKTAAENLEIVQMVRALRMTCLLYTSTQDCPMRTRCKARAIPFPTKRGFWKPMPNRMDFLICAGTPTKMCIRDRPYSVSFAGSRVNPMPISPGSGKWRIKKILLPYP